MVKSAHKLSSSVPPFLNKCYEMVDDAATDSIISWGRDNNSFVIWDMTRFTVDLLPKYFKHGNFSSFMRQLNIYGFRKIDTDHWEFATDGFIRGQKHLLKNISRRKNAQGCDQPKALLHPDVCDSKSGENENAGLWKEVENLKTGRNALKQELVKLCQHQETTDNKLLLLRNRLNGMEKIQQQMLSFLVMAVQTPGFLVRLLPLKEKNWRLSETGNMLEQVGNDGQVLSNGAIVRYQPPMGDASAPEPPPIPGLGPKIESDLSPEVLKDFFLNPDFMKVLMDENLGLENQVPFILPDLHDDTAWEHLLASPFSENPQKGNSNSKGAADSEAELESEKSGSHTEESQDLELLCVEETKCGNLDVEAGAYQADMEKLNNIEFLTKQMGLLAPEPGKKYEAKKKVT